MNGRSIDDAPPVSVFRAMKSVHKLIAQTATVLIPFALTTVRAYDDRGGHASFLAGMLVWSLFTLSSVATGIYLHMRDPALLERRMRFGPLAEPRLTQRIIMIAILAMFLALAIVPGLDHRFGWSHVPAAVVIIANLAIVAMFGFFILVLRENTFAASTITVEPGQRVVSTGPYACVRHPMYSDGLLLIFAMPLAMGSLAALPIAALSLPLLVARILDEECALAAELPGYDAYRSTVRYRLVPMVW
jgi:protein-S-isoprenylcysteine O-methyltransferase Ste14